MTPELYYASRGLAAVSVFIGVALLLLSFDRLPIIHLGVGSFFVALGIGIYWYFKD